MSTPKKKTTCIHYARGSCKNGTKCTFSHSSVGAPSPFSSSSPPRHTAAPPVSKPCIFYAQGTCRYRDTCRDLHVPATPSTSSSPQTPTKPPAVSFGMRGPPTSPIPTSPFGPCKFFMQGFCKERENCPFPHIGKPQRAPCRFFAAGACTMGPLCSFEHVLAALPNVTPPSPVPVRTIRSVRRFTYVTWHFTQYTRLPRRC